MTIPKKAVKAAGNAYWNMARRQDGQAQSDKWFKPGPQFAERIEAAIEAALPHLSAQARREEIARAIEMGLKNWDDICRHQNRIMYEYRQGNGEGDRPPDVTTTKVSCIADAVLALSTPSAGEVDPSKLSDGELILCLEEMRRRDAAALGAATPSAGDAAAVIRLSDPAVIIAGIRQFGLAPDGSDLRDLEAAFQRLASPTNPIEREGNK